MEVVSPFPKVYTMENMVIIEKSDGVRQLWGYEASLDEAKRVAEILQLELRVMHYVLEHIDNPHEVIYGSLRDLAPVELISEMITEAEYQRNRAKYFEDR